VKSDIQNETDMRKQQTLALFVLFWGSLRETLSDSTVHGLANMFRTRNELVRIVWSFLFLAGLGLAIYFTYLSTNGYFNYKVTTSVQSIDEAPINFP
jgi:hypothetical protein